METVGFIGLGRLGTPMALNIQKAGYSMVVHDVREAATRPLLEGGAKLAGSPAEVAALSQIVCTSLPAPRDVEGVVQGREGLLEGIKEGALYLDLTTCGPDLLRRLEPMFQKKGVHVMDTPVLSSPDVAVERKLIAMAGGRREDFDRADLIRRLEPIFQQKGVHVMDTPVLSSPVLAVERYVIAMAGGRREDFDRARPVLEAFADKVVYTGGLGTACVCKLVNNMTTMAMNQVMAEALTLGVKAGVELDVIRDTATRFDLKLSEERFSQTAFLDQYQSPIFTLALALKDVALATELGRASSVPMPIANQVEQAMRHCINKGWGENDFTRVFQLQEEAAGVEVRSSKAGQ
jgi:3-hydroxyisobutyrate dehydrogenase-like beta-hydroxyacid dehydrogenase